MGLAFLDNGCIDEAAKSFEYLVKTNPEYCEGLIYLSILAGAKGDFEHAARFYIQALDNQTDLLFADNEIVNIFRNWQKQNPQSTEAKYYTGMVLKGFGHYDEALDMYQQVLKEIPSMEVVKSEIGWIENAKAIYGTK
jgi:tetratricopeptide (TPR) repeat protein